MMRRSTTAMALVALFLLGGRSIAVAEPPIVRVELYDWGIRTSRPEVSAGPVTFEVRNTASHDVHEMVVLRTDLSPRGLPYDVRSARVRENRAGYVGEVSDLRPGQRGSLTLTLAPGRYVLICNEPGHYPAGMVASLVIQ